MSASSTLAAAKKLENHERELRAYLSAAGDLPGDEHDAAIRQYRKRFEEF